MNPLSASPEERARKATSIVLQRLAPDGTQRNLAQAWGVSESILTRLKEYVEPVMRLLAQLGLKVVPAEMKCYSSRELDAMFVLAKANLRHVRLLAQSFFLRGFSAEQRLGAQHPSPNPESRRFYRGSP